MTRRQISPADQDRLYDVASAMRVATDDEMALLSAAINAAASDDDDHVLAVAREIVDRHREPSE